MSARLLLGDSLDVLKTLDADSVERGRNKTQRGDEHPFRRDREKYLPLMRENARRSWGNGE